MSDSKNCTSIHDKPKLLIFSKNKRTSKIYPNNIKNVCFSNFIFSRVRVVISVGLKSYRLYCTQALMIFLIIFLNFRIQKSFLKLDIMICTPVWSRFDGINLSTTECSFGSIIKNLKFLVSSIKSMHDFNLRTPA